MPKLPVVSGREAVRALERIGYRLDRQRGSHMILRHGDPPHRRLTVPDHRELAKGTLRASVRPRGAGEIFEVRTPVAVISVVGTDFVVTHDPREGTLVQVAEGVVRVTDLHGRHQGDVGDGAKSDADNEHNYS